jgi:hypothetical protein
VSSILALGALRLFPRHSARCGCFHGIFGYARLAFGSPRTADKRDQRIFLDRPLPEETLTRILQAGRMTGSSKNVEPNRFVVVRDRACVAALAALSPAARWMSRAAAIVVIAQTREHRSTPAAAPRT